VAWATTAMYDLVNRFTEIETLNKISDILPQMKQSSMTYVTRNLAIQFMGDIDNTIYTVFPDKRIDF